MRFWWFDGYDMHFCMTEDEAREGAAAAVTREREKAIGDEFSDQLHQVCWGTVVERVLWLDDCKLRPVKRTRTAKEAAEAGLNGTAVPEIADPKTGDEA